MQEDHISSFLKVKLDLAEAPIYQDVENSCSQSFVFCTRALDPWATWGDPVAPYSSPSRLLSCSFRYNCQVLVLHRTGEGAAAPGLLGGVLLRGPHSRPMLVALFSLNRVLNYILSQGGLPVSCPYSGFAWPWPIRAIALLLCIILNVVPD